MKLFKSKKGFVQLIIPGIILIIFLPLIIGGLKVSFGIMDFLNAPLTGNIPIWTFFLGIIVIILLFKRREKQFTRR